MKLSSDEIIAGLPKRDVRAVSRLITLAENLDPEAERIISKLPLTNAHAHIVGITGSPGAGKSTLVDQIAMTYAKQNKSVAILAVDPSSPFSGGAILGDRIRMVKTVESSGIFIRSMASRGALGGIAHATLKAVRILDLAGFDLILVETVGVGQAEVDIVRCADTCLVVMVPGMGDSVQAIKAGILEIADLYVINKADREGAFAVERDLIMLLSLAEYSEMDWKPQILQTVATTGQGCEDLVSKIEEHKKWLASSSNTLVKKHYVISEAIVQFAAQKTAINLKSSQAELLSQLAKQCLERKIDILTAADLLLKSFKP